MIVTEIAVKLGQFYVDILVVGERLIVEELERHGFTQDDRMRGALTPLANSKSASALRNDSHLLSATAHQTAEFLLIVRRHVNT